ncbi:MAG TPA: glycoside hydrolase 43 family protein [Verrucomicrobiae bacterium]|nr:glycoside hydrolase 43 family protein [Verrucomicrobiae bacterium]
MKGFLSVETTGETALPVAAANNFAYPWVSDQGNGTYRNPVIYADYSDPDVIRVGEDFYLVASSFNCSPGLPILHSRDLVNWKIINHALKHVPHPRYDEVQPGCGVWAPSIRFHAGKYWIFFPTPDEGIYVTTANHPAEKWSEPQLLQAGRGLIDPCPLWDDDGKAYLVHAYAGSRAGIKHRLRVCPMATDASKLLGEGEIVFHQPEKHPTLEGPKFLKRDGWYYILAPAGGVENGWQVALRSKNIFGPYEDKIVLAQGGTHINGPHQGALVDTVNGDWWFVHFQDAGVYGRIIHLQPVEWPDGWPIMGNHGEPVSHHAKPFAADAEIFTPQTSDEFDSAQLGLQWQWNANYRNNWYSLTTREGWLRLFPQPARQEKLILLPNLLLQKFPARSFTCETHLEFAPEKIGDQAGLIISGEQSATLALEKAEKGNQLVLRVDGVAQFTHEDAPDVIKLRVSVRDGGLCNFSVGTPNGWTTIPKSFVAQKGVWIGARLGLYSLAGSQSQSTGYADFDYFRFI